MTVFRGAGGTLGFRAGIWTCLLPFHSLWAVGQDSIGSYQVAFFGARVNGVLGTLALNTFLFLMPWATPEFQKGRRPHVARSERQKTPVANLFIAF
ncbi:MAG: hypothetical protein HY735_10125 [Verrucomicrobia bacterium]|nr:hypothetical protein [Verrucomicrobiota bacterium]